MLLRYHSKLYRLESCVWPPAWTRIEGDGPGELNDESAVLRSATLSQLDPPRTCYLTVEKDCTKYMGTLLCDDSEFCRSLCEILQQHIGKSLKIIGDIDVA